MNQKLELGTDKPSHVKITALQRAEDTWKAYQKYESLLEALDKTLNEQQKNKAWRELCAISDRLSDVILANLGAHLKHLIRDENELRLLIEGFCALSCTPEDYLHFDIDIDIRGRSDVVLDEVKAVLKKLEDLYIDSVQRNALFENHHDELFTLKTLLQVVKDCTIRNLGAHYGNVLGSDLDKLVVVLDTIRNGIKKDLSK